jgi:DNA replication ATP-dependent helicase Dna2
MATKFVLVGDHYQLPPLFAKPDAATKEPISLFKHLSEAHPEAISYLSLQYRMNGDIMTLANNLIYDNRLRCGTHKVQYSLLQAPAQNSFLEDIHRRSRCLDINSCWVKNILDPHKCVLFYNTDLLPAPETKAGPWIENAIEVQLVYQTVRSLIESGVPSDEIGVISPYKYQLQKLSKVLSTYPQVETLTVDKFQGQDKKCIIISLVRSNSMSQCGDLIKDWRRVNVAITRAEQKMIFFGSKKTISNSVCFANLFKLLEANNWVFTN